MFTKIGTGFCFSFYPHQYSQTADFVYTVKMTKRAEEELACL